MTANDDIYQQMVKVEPNKLSNGARAVYQQIIDPPNPEAFETQLLRCFVEQCVDYGAEFDNALCEAATEAGCTCLAQLGDNYTERDFVQLFYDKVDIGADDAVRDQLTQQYMSQYQALPVFGTVQQASAGGAASAAAAAAAADAATSSPASSVYGTIPLKEVTNANFADGVQDKAPRLDKKTEQTRSKHGQMLQYLAQEIRNNQACVFGDCEFILMGDAKYCGNKRVVVKVGEVLLCAKHYKAANEYAAS